jgi:IS5 family transposase
MMMRTQTEIPFLRWVTLTERKWVSFRERRSPGDSQVTVGADKGYDTKGFVADARALNATPHVAQKQRSAIDGRTTRHEGYKISQQKRKRVEEIFGWMKTVGGLRKLRHRGLDLVGWMFTFTAAAYNLVRIRNLTKSVAGANA